MDRRDFVRTTAAGVAAAATPATLSAQPSALGAPAVHIRRARPLCVADVSSIRYKNGGPESAIERAYRGKAIAVTTPRIARTSTSSRSENPARPRLFQRGFAGYFMP